MKLRLLKLLLHQTLKLSKVHFDINNKQDKVNYAVSEREDGVMSLTTLTRMTGCAGMYWDVFGSAGLSCTGLYWTVLGSTGLYWVVLGHIA